MIRSRFRVPQSLLAAMLAVPSLLLSGAALADIKFPSVPLYLSNGVPPNVMLMIDDSGSMQSIIWDDGYDASVTYPSWAPGFAIPSSVTGPAAAANTSWLNGAGQIAVDGLGTTALINGILSSCGIPTSDPSSVVAIGQSGNQFKCLKLPTPADPKNLYSGSMYSANYLNYLFGKFGTAYNRGTINPAVTDLSTGQIPNDYRMNVARNVAKTVVADSANSNLKFCLSTLNQDAGGSILFGCDLLDTTSKRNSFNSKVDSLYAFTYTPLAETMYELTRYFRGMSSYYNAGVTYASGPLTTPLKNSYRCQSNYAVFITDGYPTQDTKFPGYGGNPTSGETVLSNGGTGGKLPDWDNQHPATTTANFPARLPQFSDGFAPSGSSTNEGYTLFLDDLASYAYDLDMKVGGTDPAGKSYDDTTINNGQQNLKSFFIGMATRNQMMDDAAGYGAGTPGAGKAFQANNQAQLSAQLQLALNAVTQQTSGAASVAASGGAVTTESLLFQAIFDSGSWTGELLAYGFDKSLSNNSCADYSTASTVCVWSAATTNDKQYHNVQGAANRRVYTYNTSTRTGTVFQWDNLSAAQQAILNTNPAAPPALDGLGQKRVNYLRGDPSDEFVSPNGLFRPREHVLGDFVNSNPLYVGPPGYDYGYNDYEKFHNSNSNRTPMVYVGGNDGMLHAFQGDVSGKGKELFSYIPSQVFGSTASPQLSKLTMLAYSHTWMVDGPLAAGDAYVSGSWKSVLVGTLGRGGRGVYALDVTTPTSFSASNVMWEFTSDDDSDLGYVLGEPSIVRVKDGGSDRWAAIISSGYNNSNNKGQAAIFVLFLDHTRGSTWKKNTDYYKVLLPNTSTDISATNQNGAAAPAVIDRNGDGYADTIYVGDLYGNMWKLNQSNGSGDWDVALGGSPLFVARDGTSAANRQPITERPNVGYNLLIPLANNNNNVVLYFGTGRFLDSSDPKSKGVQSFYGIFDNGFSVAPSISRSNLQVQTIKSVVNAAGGTYRTVSSNTINTQTQYGFYMDLPGTASTGAAERQIFTPQLLDGRVIFTTLIPSTADPCLASTSGWIMEIDATNGGQLNNAVFDTNNDGSFNSADQLVGGVLSTNGAPSGLTIINNNNGTESKFTNGSDGKMSEIKEQSTARLGRISWYELTP